MVRVTSIIDNFELMNSNDDVVDSGTSLPILLHDDMIPIGPDFRSNEATYKNED
jgi:hypothetical protein